MIKDTTERPLSKSELSNRDSGRLTAMSRMLLFILPALFAAAAALLWEPVNEFLGGLQQPLQVEDHTYTTGFPNLKLNDGRYIPVVSRPHSYSIL